MIIRVMTKIYIRDHYEVEATMSCIMINTTSCDTSALMIDSHHTLTVWCIVGCIVTETNMKSQLVRFLWFDFGIWIRVTIHESIVYVPVHKMYLIMTVDEIIKGIDHVTKAFSFSPFFIYNFPYNIFICYILYLFLLLFPSNEPSPFPPHERDCL